MANQVFSGSELEKALQDDGLTATQSVLTGMVKPSEVKGQISLTLTNCDNWVSVPIAMIERAENIGQSGCRDHVHPVIRLTLKEPKSPEARVLLSLLTQVTSSLANNPMPVGASDGVEQGGDGQFMAARGSSFGGFGRFGGFGGFGSTLPRCYRAIRKVPCGSALPGYPVPMCDELVYCCVWPNGMETCI